MIDLEVLSSYTSSKLKKLCRKESIRGYSKLKKDDLLIYIKTELLTRQVEQGIVQLESQ